MVSSASKLGSLIAEAVADAAQRVLSGKWTDEGSSVRCGEHDEALDERSRAKKAPAKKRRFKRAKKSTATRAKASKPAATRKASTGTTARKPAARKRRPAARKGAARRGKAAPVRRRQAAPAPKLSGGAVFELEPRQPRIEAAATSQRRVRAFLDDPSVIHDHDAVRRAHGCEPVRDDDRRAVGHQPVERVLHKPLAFRIER